MAGVMMVVLLNLSRRQSLVLVASEIYRLCEVCQQLGNGLKSENKIHGLQSIARIPSVGRAPSRGSTVAGEGLWLYFKVFLLLFPLPPQAARTSAGSEISAVCPVGWFLHVGYLYCSKH